MNRYQKIKSRLLNLGNKPEEESKPVTAGPTNKGKEPDRGNLSAPCSKVWDEVWDEVMERPITTRLRHFLWDKERVWPSKSAENRARTTSLLLRMKGTGKLGPSSQRSLPIFSIEGALNDEIANEYYLSEEYRSDNEFIPKIDFRGKKEDDNIEMDEMPKNKIPSVSDNHGMRNSHRNTYLRAIFSNSGWDADDEDEGDDDDKVDHIYSHGDPGLRSPKCTHEEANLYEGSKIIEEDLKRLRR
jgi:hypothetical protein